ncbi:hypothetical protein NCC49_001269 [Naganishia albida]|nr:hypothetical protein NCC49_001269 [Naganishia albida]
MAFPGHPDRLHALLVTELAEAEASAREYRRRHVECEELMETLRVENEMLEKELFIVGRYTGNCPAKKKISDEAYDPPSITHQANASGPVRAAEEVAEVREGKRAAMPSVVAENGGTPYDMKSLDFSPGQRGTRNAMQVIRSPRVPVISLRIPEQALDLPLVLPFSPPITRNVPAPRSLIPLRERRNTRSPKDTTSHDTLNLAPALPDRRLP